MGFDWRSYLTLATILSKENSQENHRCAISRAYYAVYNILRIRANYQNTQAISSHRTFIDSLKNPSDDLFNRFPFEGKSDLIFHSLEYLRLARNEADYDGTILIRKNDCDSIISKAESIFEMLDDADNTAL